MVRNELFEGSTRHCGLFLESEVIYCQQTPRDTGKDQYISSASYHLSQVLGLCRQRRFRYCVESDGMAPLEMGTSPVGISSLTSRSLPCLWVQLSSRLKCAFNCFGRRVIEALLPLCEMVGRPLPLPPFRALPSEGSVPMGHHSTSFQFLDLFIRSVRNVSSQLNLRKSL